MSPVSNIPIVVGTLILHQDVKTMHTSLSIHPILYNYLSVHVMLRIFIYISVHSISPLALTHNLLHLL